MNQKNSVDVVPRDVVRVFENGYAKYAQTIRSRHIQVLADEPTSIGGADTGLSPYELMSAGLGACTSMTLRMYSERKKWDVGDITVDVRHKKVKDASGNDVDEFQRELSIGGSPSDEQRAKLLEIADKCPVHRTLHRVSAVKTDIV